MGRPQEWKEGSLRLDRGQTGHLCAMALQAQHRGFSQLAGSLSLGEDGRVNSGRCREGPSCER